MPREQQEGDPLGRRELRRGEVGGGNGSQRGSAVQRSEKVLADVREVLEWGDQGGGGRGGVCGGESGFEVCGAFCGSLITVTLVGA